MTLEPFTVTVPRTTDEDCDRAIELALKIAGLLIAARNPVAVEIAFVAVLRTLAREGEFGPDFIDRVINGVTATHDSEPCVDA